MPVGTVRNITVGEIIRKDYLEPKGITIWELAEATGINQPFLELYINKNKGHLTPYVAHMLANYFGCPPNYFYNLQWDTYLRSQYNT